LDWSFAAWASRESLDAAQSQLNLRLTSRRSLLHSRNSIEDRLTEIEELLARFDLLRKHYEVDTTRLASIQEGGSMFVHIERATCPLCGANPGEQHLEDDCDGNVEAVVMAASAEITKIQQLDSELLDTVTELQEEKTKLQMQFGTTTEQYEAVDAEIRETVTPQVGDARAAFSSLVEERASVQKAIDLHERVTKLEQRKRALLELDEGPQEKQPIAAGLSEAVSHALSLKMETLLKAWNFPGECHVHFDKATSDFVIDGKPRGSRGKGLRAITHSAVTLGLLEYCQEHSLPHPGFVILDSPLLAYFEPEGDEDHALKGTDLKERFYEYLIQHHHGDSQIIIIENQHPPTEVEGRLSMTVFTGNPSEGRFGLL
jgi:hypothetical protein